MPETGQDSFRQMAADHPTWNFTFFYAERQKKKVHGGLWMTIKLSIICVMIGIIGTAKQGARSRILCRIVQGQPGSSATRRLSWN